MPARSPRALVAARSGGLALVAVWGLLIVAGLAGCSGAAADCNVVRLQREAGRSDAAIAKAIGSSERAVLRCEGKESTMMDTPQPLKQTPR